MTTFCGRRDLFYTYWTGHTHDELAKNGSRPGRIATPELRRFQNKRTWSRDLPKVHSDYHYFTV
jgi:hypothetical protein